MLEFTKRFAFGPAPGSPWAEKMVLNPALAADPGDPDTLHMLFRATGPWPQAQLPGKPLPYPIFLGYAVSHDRGKNWECDFSRPALAPQLRSDPKNPPMVTDAFGREMFDYSNGCIEDPRLFDFEGELHLSVACRAFPPGPYWEHDDPVQCMPSGFASFGAAVRENSTVSLLYRVDLAALAARDYEHAFRFVTPLHEPDVSDNRDVVLMPRRISIGGKKKVACIHRPKCPWKYEIARDLKTPSIFLAVADSLADLCAGKAEQQVLAVPQFEWEADRIGASWAPLELEPGLWLLPCHGKQDDRVGYTQTFMLLRETGKGLEIVARPPQRLLYASEPWELEGDFATPCLFTCSGIVLDDGTLLMGYGAADSKVGIAEVGLKELKKTLPA